MPINFLCLSFNELNVQQLYAILRLRSQVFVVQQNCVYLDLDDVDKQAYHFFAVNEDGECVACTRLIPPQIVYDYGSIGRVVTHPNYRKSGLGKQLMQESIRKCYELFGNQQTIKIGAQLYLKKFYESFGFAQIGVGYIEDGIPHIHMLLTKQP